MSLRLILKKEYPALYEIIRQPLFVFVHHYRQAKLRTFTKPMAKTVHIHGQTFSIQIDPSNGFIDEQIYVSGYYEPDILAVIKANLPVGGTYVDIGANIGQHALFAASLVGPLGSVHAFEPIKKLTEQIKQSVATNRYTDRFKIHNVACGAVACSAHIDINSQNIGGSKIDTTRTDSDAIIYIVPADTILADLPRIDLIKIDTEGFELDVLEGLTVTLTKHKPALIIEYSPSLWDINQRSEMSQRFFSILRAHGYTIFDLEVGHRKIENDTDWISQFTKLQTNLLCINVWKPSSSTYLKTLLVSLLWKSNSKDSLFPMK